MWENRHSLCGIPWCFKAKPSPFYPTRHIFWEISKRQPQHCSLLNEGATTGWQKSYGTNSSNSIPPFIFYMVFFTCDAQDNFFTLTSFFVPSSALLRWQGLLSHHLLPQRVAWNTVGCRDFKSASFLRICANWHQEWEQEILNRPVFQCHRTNCTFKKYLGSKQPQLKPVHSLRVHFDLEKCMTFFFIWVHV